MPDPEEDGVFVVVFDKYGTPVGQELDELRVD